MISNREQKQIIEGLRAACEEAGRQLQTATSLDDVADVLGYLTDRIEGVAQERGALGPIPSALGKMSEDSLDALMSMSREPGVKLDRAGPNPPRQDHVGALNAMVIDRLDDLTVPELRKLAEERGIGLKSKMRKAEIIEALS